MKRSVPFSSTVLIFTTVFFAILVPLTGNTQSCFSVVSQKGDAAFSAGAYGDAIKIWQNAKKCSDAPANNDLDTRIQKAEAAMKPKTKPTSRTKSKDNSDESDNTDSSSEEKKRTEENKSLAEEKSIADTKAAAEAKRIADANAAAEAKRIADANAIADAKILAEAKLIADAKAITDAKVIVDEKAAAEIKRIAEERIAAEMKRITEEKAAAEAKRITDEKAIADAKIAAENKKIADQRIREDENAWRKSETGNTIESYRTYLNKFSTGYYIKDAEYRVDSLEIRELLGQIIMVEGGSFVMGSNNKLHNPDVRPSHRVHLKNFFIGKNEITQAKWKAVMGKYPEELVFTGCNNCPVTNVSWIDVQLFLATLSHKSGKNFRLPTEAEWEYAAKGGKASKDFKFSGDNVANKVAWYDANSAGKISLVGLKQYNELTLYDMSGNVQEWCQDGYNEKYYQRSPSDNPINNNDTQFRVTRGGSFKDPEISNSITVRGKLDADKRSDKVGFRIALDAFTAK